MTIKYLRLTAMLLVTFSSTIALADQNNGQLLWNSVVNDRSCTGCHGDQPTKTGKHIKTGKIIEPMALSINGKRFQDKKKIDKWFRRNCKWTFGRECSVQEKVDILSWLSNQ